MTGAPSVFPLPLPRMSGQPKSLAAAAPDSAVDDEEKSAAALCLGRNSATRQERDVLPEPDCELSPPEDNEQPALEPSSPSTDDPGAQEESPDARRHHAGGLRRACHCCALASGVIVALSGHGVFQERIMTIPYDGELFHATAFLVLCNRVVAVSFALCGARCRGEALSRSAPFYKYLLVSVGNFAAAMCQYEALKWVSFTMQLLGKSFKMIPVMLWSIAMSGKRYAASDWLSSLMVTFGIMEFMASGSIASHRASSEGDSVYGLLLLVGFLLADSFTSTLQEKLFRDHKTTKYSQMFYVNLCSSFISFLCLAFQNNIGPSLRFCTAHPTFPTDAALISLASVVAQYFIVSMVKDFGALALAATMNVRQLWSILLSDWTYGRTMSFSQAVAIFVVFAALLSKSVGRVFWSSATEALPESKPGIRILALTSRRDGDLEAGTEKGEQRANLMDNNDYKKDSSNVITNSGDNGNILSTGPGVEPPAVGYTLSSTGSPKTAAPVDDVGDARPSPGTDKNNRPAAKFAVSPDIFGKPID